MAIADSFVRLAKWRDGHAFGHFIEHAKAATAADYPELIERFSEMCRDNRIARIPTIMVTDPPTRGGLSNLQATQALPRHNQILAEKSFLDHASPDHQLAAMAVETGHILGRHCLPRVKHARTADRLAVQLLGSQEPMLAFVNAHRRYRLGDFYGSMERQAANIRAADPTNRSMLNWMIAEHDKRFAGVNTAPGLTPTGAFRQ